MKFCFQMSSLIVWLTTSNDYTYQVQNLISDSDMLVCLINILIRVLLMILKTLLKFKKLNPIKGI